MTPTAELAELLANCLGIGLALGAVVQLLRSR